MNRVGAPHRKRGKVRDASVTRWAPCFSPVRSTHRVPIAATAASDWLMTGGWAWPARRSSKRWVSTSSQVQVFHQMDSCHRWVTCRTRRPTSFSRTPRRPKPNPALPPSTLAMNSLGKVASMLGQIMRIMLVVWVAGLSGKISTIRMLGRR